MTRKEKRQKIDQAIKDISIPFFRNQGFKGSLPHFRRYQDDRINLITIQHSLYDTKFVIEIANCPSNGFTTSWGEEIKKNKVTAHDISMRHRLGSEKHNTDYWFDYGRPNLFQNVYDNIAIEIIDLWSEAENWWSIDPYNQRIELKSN